jgi:hypothetical protein
MTAWHGGHKFEGHNVTPSIDGVTTRWGIIANAMYDIWEEIQVADEHPVDDLPEELPQLDPTVIRGADIQSQIDALRRIAGEGAAGGMEEQGAAGPEAPGSFAEANNAGGDPMGAKEAPEPVVMDMVDLAGEGEEDDSEWAAGDRIEEETRYKLYHVSFLAKSLREEFAVMAGINLDALRDGSDNIIPWPTLRNKRIEAEALEAFAAMIQIREAKDEE